MKTKNKPIDVFNETFLCDSLNAFEGNSNYFKEINEHFAAFFVNFFKHYNIDTSVSLLLLIKNSPAYIDHPFIPFILKFSLSENITKKIETNITNSLKNYPAYPLAPYLELILSNKPAKPGQNRADYLALMINYLKDPLQNEDNLKILSKAGFAFATFRILLNNLIRNDLSSFASLLSLLAQQNGGNVQDVTIRYLEMMLKTYNHSNSVKQEIYRLLVAFGATKYLLPLVDTYEKDNSFTEAFFYLQQGHALNIQEASLRLLAYYKSGEHLPTNKEIIKYLEDKLN